LDEGEQIVKKFFQYVSCKIILISVIVGILHIFISFYIADVISDTFHLELFKIIKIWSVILLLLNVVIIWKFGVGKFKRRVVQFLLSAMIIWSIWIVAFLAMVVSLMPVVPFD